MGLPPLLFMAPGICLSRRGGLLLDTWPPRDPFAQRGTMYWSDVAQLLYRNKGWHSQLRINYYPNIWHDRVTLCDWQRPEREIRKGNWLPHKETLGAASTVEYEAHAVVCNIGWINGECPMDTVKPLWKVDAQGQQTAHVLRHMVRGVRDGVKIALEEGALRPTVELGLLIGNWEMVRRCWGDE